MGAVRRTTGDHHRTVRWLTDPVPELDADTEVAAWAASGAMALTGRVDGPALGPPAGLVSRLAALGADMEDAAARIGRALRVAPLELLAERAAIAGLHRRGAVSVGGATRLVPAADGAWVAVSLARPDDVALVPAWLELETVGDPWAAVEAAVRARPADEVVDRARLLGLPASVLGEAATRRRPPVLTTVLGDADRIGGRSDLVAVELASLWAGPLCGSLLQGAGLSVTKVESTARPDGARRGPLAFFELLNAGKRFESVDLGQSAGIERLRALVRSADVVIEGSRPRALEQLGLDAEALVADGGPRVWISLTGHGRTGPERDWVAFGDDAAVAGGLVVRDDSGPLFCADAVADPISGVVAAGAALEALASGQRVVLDVALSAVAAACAGPTLAVPPDASPAAPRVVRTVSGGSGR
jgi:hypothetical protein